MKEEKLPVSLAVSTAFSELSAIADSANAAAKAWHCVFVVVVKQ